VSRNKETVRRYMDGFNKSDHAEILSCLTDDVVWDMPGFPEAPRPTPPSTPA
jgi:ketosteroid isomerase-like protein